MKNSKFYRAKLIADHGGLRVQIDEYISFYESDCYAWCSEEFSHKRAVRRLSQEGALIRDVKNAMNVKRINKQGSRFASNTKELAIKNLVFRKKLQVSHLKRELEFANAFLNSDIESLDSHNAFLIKETRELVDKYYVFD